MIPMYIAALVAQAEEVAGQPGPLWILGQVGVIGAITATFAMLHRSAINAYRESAAKSERIADLERKRADTANQQLVQLLAPIRSVGEKI